MLSVQITIYDIIETPGKAWAHVREEYFFCCTARSPITQSSIYVVNRRRASRSISSASTSSRSPEIRPITDSNLSSISWTARHSRLWAEGIVRFVDDPDNITMIEALMALHVPHGCSTYIDSRTSAQHSDNFKY